MALRTIEGAEEGRSAPAQAEQDLPVQHRLRAGLAREERGEVLRSDDALAGAVGSAAVLGQAHAVAPQAHPVVVDPDADVEFGAWNDSTKTFTVLTGAAQSGADAVRVTARRTAAGGNAVPLLLARVVGRTSCDVRATSIARYNPATSIAGIEGLNGITMSNNAFVGSYNSATTTTPAEASATAVGNLYSNGAIVGSGGDVEGGVVLGPSAPGVVGISVSGTTTRAASPLAPPAEMTWSPAPNPNGLPQNYTASGNVTLPAGIYWFTSLTVNGSLIYSGPATVVINGPVEINGALRAYNLIPANLRVYQIGNYTFADSDSNGNNIDIVADVSAPSAHFMAKNSLLLRGRLVAGSIEVKNNADFFYDVGLGGAGGNGSKVVTVR